MHVFRKRINNSNLKDLRQFHHLYLIVFQFTYFSSIMALLSIPLSLDTLVYSKCRSQLKKVGEKSIFYPLYCYDLPF